LRRTCGRFPQPYHLDHLVAQLFDIPDLMGMLLGTGPPDTA